MKRDYVWQGYTWEDEMQLELGWI